MPDETTKPDTLEQAVTKAVNSTTEEPETKETPEDKPTEVKKESEESEEEKSEDPFSDFTDQDTTNAKAIYKALKDPNSPEGQFVINKILDLAKVNVKDITTKADVKDAKKDIKEVIKDELGEDYKFFADKIANAVEKALNIAVDDKTKDIRENIRTERQQKLADTLLEAQNKIYADFPQAKELEADMVKMMDRMQPGKGVTPYDYMANVLYIVAGQKGIQIRNKSTNERLKTNRNDAHSRIASEGVQPSGVTKTPTKLNIDQAIKATLDEVATQK